MASARTQSAAHRLRQDLRRLRHRSYITGEIDLAAVQDGGGERPRTEERVGERVRIARDLHDTLLQTVQVLMLRLQAVHEILPPGNAKDELEQTMEIGDQAIVEGRSTVHDLRSRLVTTRLPEAIRALADELSTGKNVSFGLRAEGQVLDLHPMVRDDLYSISREALRNAFNHACAQNIEAEIAYDARQLRLRIRDNGQDVPPEILKEGRSGHYG